MTSLTALVLDSNSLGPQLRLDLIGDVVATARTNRFRVWVPEIVVWEIAEHEHKAFTDSLPRHRKSVSRAMKLGLPVAPLDELSIADYVRAIRNQLASHPEIEVIPLDGESAKAAVRDQVLQTGPGSLKQEVKTGAADSAWLRSIAARNGGHLDGLILATGDKKAVAHLCAEEGLRTPPTVSDFNAARLHAGWRMAASAELVARVQDWIDRLLPLTPGAADAPYDPSEIGLDNFWLWEASADSSWDELFSVDALTNVEDASISDDGSELSATMTFEANVAYLMIDEDREGDLIPRLINDGSAVVHADVKVTLGPGDAITSIRFGG